MTNETTLDKIQGARTVKDMILWSGMTQKEIMTLEDKLGDALRRLWSQKSDAARDTGHELAPIRGQVTDAGIHVWRHGYPEQKDYRPEINHWQPDVSEREA